MLIMETQQGLIQRKSNKRNYTNSILNTEKKFILTDQLHLMDKVLLLELANNNGKWSFWNESISLVLRGCILIELALQDRIELQKLAVSQNLTHRKVIIKNHVATDVPVLNEAMKYIYEDRNSLKTVQAWIRLFNGDSFSSRTKYHLYNLRERIAKDLTEKGLVTIEKVDYFLFEVFSFPLANADVKCSLIKKLHDFLIKNWTTNMKSVDKHELAFVLMAYASKVIKEIIPTYSDEDFELAENRLEQLASYWRENICCDDASDIVWAVFAAVM